MISKQQQNKMFDIVDGIKGNKERCIFIQCLQARVQKFQIQEGTTHLTKHCKERRQIFHPQ